MYKILAQLLFFFIASYQLEAQILPAEGSKLNYRIVGFSFPQGRSGSKYKIQIAEGNYNNTDSFKKKITRSFSGSNNKIIGEVPSFGKQYTWCIVTDVKSVETKSQLHHFSTLMIPDVDSNVTRLRILKRAEAYKDAFVFLDANRTLYDMNGNPVWFLPIVDGVVADNFPSYGDIKLTKQGTITFITNRKSGHIYEINYNGDVLWKGPNNGKVSGDTIEYYNHEFTRLSNGHYMVMGGEYVSLKLPAAPDSFVLKSKESKGKIIWDDKTRTFYQRVQFGTLIEYDSGGNIVWSWKSSGYFKGSDLYKQTNKLGYFDIDDVHENSFYYDEKAKAIYVSYRNMSRIIKVKYPGGEILNIYGKLCDQGEPGYDNNLFHHQHSVRHTEEGYLSVYNNNNRHIGSLPTLLIMQEPVSAKDTLKKIWEYECTTDGIDTTLKDAPEFAGLGSLTELPDHSMLACMTTDDYTRVFIVSRDKKTLWSAMPERRFPNQNHWHTILEYKPSMITNRKYLEQLIWNAEAKGLHD